jgi:hypothetical protein
MRNTLEYATALFVRGINQDPQGADFANHCADARNVWTPFGGVETRPGSEFMFHSAMLQGSSTVDYAGTADGLYKVASTVATDNIAGTLDVSSLAVEDQIYIGWSSLPAANVRPLIYGVAIVLSASNTASSRYKLEYYDGVTWKGIPALTTGDSADSFRLSSECLASNHRILFSFPGDWTASTQAFGVSSYWLRMTVKEVALDASTIITSASFVVPLGPASGITDVRSTFRSTFTGKIGPSWLFGSYWLKYVTTTLVTGWASGLKGFGDGFAGFTHVDTTGAARSLYVSEPITATSVAYEDAIYISLPDGIYQVTKDNFITPTTWGLNTLLALSPALVEDDPLIVGAGTAAPYDKALVAQLGEFPKAKYIAFFQNRFWFAGIEGLPQIVWWGAAAPYHRVIPGLNYEDVIENASEDISGMMPLGANLVVYKPSSIHQMIYTGLNAFEESTFVPQTTVKGIGCVSNSSIADVNGTHVFLSNRGLVQFDGETAKYVSQEKNQGFFSDRLQDLWPELTPGKFAFSVGVHWKSKHCYLLAVSHKGSGTNNLVIVWDYVQDAFWLWDGLDVAGWFFEDEEQLVLCYSDSYGRFFRLSGGSDFGTAIDAYVTTARLGYSSAYSSNLRMAEITGTSTNSTMAAQFITNDNDQNSGSLVFADPIEALYGTAKWGIAKWCAKKPRTRRLSVWSVGRNHQLKLSQSTKNAKFSVDVLKLGFNKGGKR